MSQKTKCFLAIGTALLLNAAMMAQSPQSSAHINGGWSWMLEDTLDSGLKTGFGFSLPLLNKTTATFDFGYWKSTVHQKPNMLFNGTLSMAPFQVSLNYYFFEKKRVNPYVFGGTGIVFTHFEMEDIVTIPEVSISQNVKNGISFHAGAGSLFRMKKNLAFYAEVCFFYRRGKATTTMEDMNFGRSTEDFNLNLNSLAFSIGIKYFL
ncbi:MAG: hypothetical protein GF421_10920 [Candidatus Aminicenantes bacterium]|nr:hypothetical protein [Candidatus Aminicenantes bacterium]